MTLLESLFGRTQTPAERLRAHLRSIQRARRELDRERGKLEVQEKSLMADIRKNAKQGQTVRHKLSHQAACKVMARDLVRVRRNIHKFYQMSTQLQAVGLRMQTLRSTQQMSEAMRGASKALSSMNRSMNIIAVQRVLQDFERETSTMDMKDEMMNDAMEDTLGGEEDAMGDGVGENEESDAILRQVLDEIGVSVDHQLGSVPSTAPAAAQTNQPVRVAIGEGSNMASSSTTDSDESALQARLDQLRKT
ncbi:ESCRT-III subunit protein did4 [Malassezia yamatoensis]|uniref:ESCRT-III subunit protein did4 n=1 Tax=Malassezia yamatoensis TaxID=253288 RepID=A0AAJ6CL14_9BASI|nr:ESCRT-III subunit protein did4 [Malassezia yamatoensis]